MTIIILLVSLGIKQVRYTLASVYGIIEVLLLMASKKVPLLQLVFAIMQFLPLFLGGIYATLTKQGSVYTNANKSMWDVLFHDMVVGDPVVIQTKKATIAMLHGTYDGFLVNNKPIAFQDITKYFPEGSYILASCAARARQNIVTPSHTFVNDKWSMRGETCCYTPLSFNGKKFVIWSSTCYDMQRNFYLSYLIDEANFSFRSMIKYNFKVIFG